MRTQYVHIHFRVLLRVHNSRDGDTEVGGRAPEICTMIMSAPWIRQYFDYETIIAKVPVQL